MRYCGTSIHRSRSTKATIQSTSDLRPECALQTDGAGTLTEANSERPLAPPHHFAIFGYLTLY